MHTQTGLFNFSQNLERKPPRKRGCQVLNTTTIPMLDQDYLRTYATQWLHAWHGNKPEELLKYYAENAFYADPAKRDGLKGKEQIGTYFTKLLAANPTWVWIVLEVMPTEKGFTLKWLARIPVGNQVLEETGLDIVELNADMEIVRNEVWFDRSRWMQLLQAK